ncbi:MAG TPA: outer membrane beta-barrel protein [Verrucomicrobiae bacterium]|nr:outer membrane beta-barrel protein [Verrucomicrobiae bacterium]
MHLVKMARGATSFTVSGVLLAVALAPVCDVSAALPMGELVAPADVPRALDAANRLLTTAQPDGLFRAGPFEFYPRISGTVYHDDNINSTATNRLKDVTWTIAPGFAATARNANPARAKLFTLEYTPAFRFYADHDELNSVDHAASIAGRLTGNKLKLGFDQRFLVTSQPVPDVGGRTDQFTAATHLTSEWRLGYKTSLQVDAALTLTDYEQFTSSRDWSNSDWLNYELSPKLSLGVGVVIGYLDVQPATNQPSGRNPDQTYEQLRVRAVSFITDKLNLSASAGGELRQYRGGVDDTLSPVWDVAATYRPWHETTLTLSLFQSYYSSAQSDSQNYLSTGAGVSVAQHFFDRFVATIGGNYSHSDYEATVTGVTSGRQDDIFRARVGLDAYITAQWSAGIYYSHERNNSNDNLFSYDKNQFGLQSSWRF